MSHKRTKREPIPIGLIVIAGLALFGILFFALAQSERPTGQEQLIQLRQLDVDEADAKARAAIADAFPKLERERWQGRMEYLLAQAFANEMEANGEALRYLATYRQRMLDNLIVFLYVVILLAVTVATITATLSLRQRLLYPQSQDVRSNTSNPAPPKPAYTPSPSVAEPQFAGEYRDASMDMR